MVTVETKKSKNKEASDYYFDFISSDFCRPVLCKWSLRFHLGEKKWFVSVRLCTFVCVCVRMCVCAYVRMCVCAYVRVYVRMSVCAYMRMYICEYLRMCLRAYVVCTYVRVCACSRLRVFVCSEKFQIIHPIVSIATALSTSPL